MFFPAPPVLFLDIDGVLIAFPENTSTSHNFTRACVDGLRTVLEAVPELRIVFSTTWRRPRHVDRLHEEWIAAGFDLDLAIDGTPELPESSNAFPLHRRGGEIQLWLHEHPEVTVWVVLDDDRKEIEPILDSSRCVFTKPQRGLTPEDATQAIEILWKQLG